MWDFFASCFGYKDVIGVLDCSFALIFICSSSVIRHASMPFHSQDLQLKSDALRSIDYDINKLHHLFIVQYCSSKHRKLTFDDEIRPR